jgi:RimJ/RimL family protein N-acetyltransferase
VKQFFDVTYRAEMEDGRPWNVHWTESELTTTLREPVGDFRMDGFCVDEDGTTKGAGLVGYSTLDNLDKAWVFPTVDPPHRGRGLGSALMSGLLDHCAHLGRTTVTLNAAYAGPEDPEAAPMRFARAHGFHLSNLEILRRLPLPVAEELLDEVEAETEPHHRDYRIETFFDEIPDELLPSYCTLVNQLGVDAPSGEVDYEEGRTTPETAHERFAQHRKLGRRVYYSLAVRDGQALAQSDLSVLPEDHKAMQWGTFVHREHRGHRLGAAVKLANLRAIQQDRPGVTEIHTQNAETNRFMVSINERLGFEIVAVNPSFVRRLDS